MRSPPRHEASGYALLLFLFGIGAFAAIVTAELFPEWISRLPITPAVCMILVLGLDSMQIASLFSWITLPAFTLLFGAASALEGMRIIGLRAANAGKQLILFLAAVTIHFILSTWGLNTVTGLHRILTGRKESKKLIAGSLLLMLTGFAVCTWLMCLLAER